MIPRFYTETVFDQQIAMRHARKGLAEYKLQQDMLRDYCAAVSAHEQQSGSVAFVAGKGN